MKVFRVWRYLLVIKDIDMSYYERAIRHNLKWQIECDGLTMKEVYEIGYAWCDDWSVEEELDGDKKNVYKQDNE